MNSQELKKIYDDSVEVVNSAIKAKKLAYENYIKSVELDHNLIRGETKIECKGVIYVFSRIDNVTPFGSCLTYGFKLKKNGEKYASDCYVGIFDKFTIVND